MVRSRVVAKEIKYRGTVEHYFAAMPPLAAFKLLLSLSVTSQFPTEKETYHRRGSRYVLGFLDVKKAHFWALAERVLFVELPEEYKRKHGITGDMVGRLLRSMYGMRDAAALWEKLVCTKMCALGFRKGRSSPCIFWHPIRDLRTNLHGDNFVSLGTRLDVDWLFAELGKEWTVKVEGILGPPGEPDTVQSIRCLNRLLTWHLGGIEYEPDPRHCQILVREPGLQNSGT